MPTIHLFHDDKAFVDVRTEGWTKKYGFDIVPVTTAAEALALIREKPHDIEVCVIHGSFGDENNESVHVFDVIRELHARNEFTRVGIITNSYPEIINFVLELKADFFFAQELDPGHPWLLSQMKRGLVSPDELTRRGFTVESPAAPGRRNLEAL